MHKQIWSFSPVLTDAYSGTSVCHLRVQLPRRPAHFTEINLKTMARWPASIDDGQYSKQFHFQESMEPRNIYEMRVMRSRCNSRVSPPVYTELESFVNLIRLQASYAGIRLRLVSQLYSVHNACIDAITYVGTLSGTCIDQDPIMVMILSFHFPREERIESSSEHFAHLDPLKYPAASLSREKYHL